MSELVMPMQILYAAFDKGDSSVEGETHRSGESISQEHILGETENKKLIDPNFIKIKIKLNKKN